MTGLQMLQAVLNLFRPFLKSGSIDKKKAEFIKKALKEMNPLFYSPMTQDLILQPLKRVTINKYLFEGNNKRIFEIDKLKYPPSCKVKKNGRANYIGQSILYATFNPVTAIKEMKPDENDLVTISTWKQNEKDYSLKISPIFKITSLDNITHNELSLKFKQDFETFSKRFSKEDAEQIDELLSFIAECFSKEVEYGNNYDYIMSAYFANKILFEYWDGNIDAIIYPSVPERLTSPNIAIKPEIFDNYFELIEVEESVLISKPNESNPNYVFLGSNRSRAFDTKTNTIIWEK